MKSCFLIEFNDFFVKSIIEINEQIPTEINNVQYTMTNHFFKFEKVNVEKICLVTKQLMKKVNKSHICNSMVWHGATEYIGHHICMIINESFNEGKFPDCWKISTVIPIPKIKNTNKCDEFGPINTMPNDEKIIECIVKDQLINYFNKHNILYEYQSAYRSNYSCESALNLFISNWKAANENGEIVIAVFLDLKRAFETISREIMATKMANIGITGNGLSWFISYMSNRKQKVNYNNSLSDVNTIPIGLPQRTKLSVCLFLLYINDIVNAVKFSKIYLFADDTVLVVKSKSVNTATNKQNK